MATYAFHHPRVVRTEQLSPGMIRVVLGGSGLAAVVSGGRDQRFKLFLPHPGQDAPVLPDVLDEDWYTRWRALDPQVRAVMRTYTVREARQDPAELDIDFALHGDLGPASAWARRARPGDPLTVLVPVVEDNGGVDFQPPAGTDWVLLTADATALPAVAGILDWLPAGTPVRAWIETDHPDERIALPAAPDAEVVRVVRDASPASRPTPLLAALTAARLPTGTPYAWLAGEAAGVRALRRHLVQERGWDRRAVSFAGYWRRGATEDQLLDEAVAEAEAEAEAATADA
jgi:NADPH-dependent ferric siderophore reductase